MIKTIRELIYKSINEDFKDIFKDSNLNLEQIFEPKINQDYELNFYIKNKLTNQITYQTKYIDEAIKDVLLFETDHDVFYNTLNIEVKAKFNDQSHYMKNSFLKVVINNSNQEEAIKDTRPFDLSTIKAHDIKINSEDKDFPVEQNKTKAQIIYDLFLERINNDINFWVRKWIYINKINLSLDVDYKIRFIKEFDSNNTPIYYEAENKWEFIEIINNVLLKDLDVEFDRNLYIEIYAMKDSSNLNGSFIKKINNNYLNKAIEEDVLSDLEINNGSNINISDDQVQELLNQMAKDESLSMWWIITPLTILGLIIASAVIVFVVRKNRRIR